MFLGSTHVDQVPVLPIARPTGTFVKYSKHGHTRLKLIAQENGVTVPVYSTGESVEGTVELDAEKVEGVDRVEVKITGRLKLNEIAEGGTSSANLALDTKLLWAKSPSSQQCPQKLDFDLMLPTTFTYEGTTYPLPPTYSVKLKGLPGFTASIEYSVAALVNRPSTVPSMVPLVKSKTLGIHIGTTNEADTDARKDMWRIDSIGQGTFSHMANEKRVSVFSGELAISDAIQVGGFRAAGLFVKDCIVLSMSPMNPGKCPFMDFRLAVPIRLVSSPWAADGTGIGARDARRSQEEPGNLDVKSS
ncbi:hypothetical protein AGABI1DRAFT_120653 [Agaricus bisporus var. burnettii JB137-S8]|uniref:Arrestin-like N-terminal domain-containing protein n=1 Tax=Agaricus bisporus var. burnettii (strain JB137-S8 / ATCC MYA-4627 / FGSC 10392) TaxID=597362 RepID=K5XVM6_AGABU|nr:uncharacterized protein AGABI1DRAFT_120653 [Agaricus bisporus var. burnettii JB137-S8]EKM79220.1 hypothetical protein AGABI1DRAFT_120653 [Agaricus bisporus var. burnettii JB137-S8]